MKGLIEKTYRFIGSKKLAMALFCLLALALIPNTLIAGKKFLFLEIINTTLLGATGVNVIFCTWQRFSKLSIPTLVIHLGVIITLLGTQISSLGYIATINIYEGSSTDKAYRWDLQKDSLLGFELTVQKINREYYPIPVKIGVLRNNEKVGLFITKTGQSFDLDEFHIKVGSLDIPTETLEYSIYDTRGNFVGTYDTSTPGALPEIFGQELKLVAFQNPVIKKIWADLILSKNNNVIAEGHSAVNEPFIWQGLRFFNTEIGKDSLNNFYAGIQIVKDPGIPFVYIGLSILSFGLVLSLKKIMARRKRV